jgi:CheY-like chemotaxis protein
MRTAQVLSQLSSLRHYAGLLTGSSEKGDALVTTTLQGIAAGDVALCGDLPLRVALFRSLHDTLHEGSEPEKGIPVSPAPKTTALDREREDTPGGAVSPVERSTLILTRLEGFFASEVAHILRMDVADVQRHLDDAERKHPLERRILIIEDNALLAIELEELIESLGHRPIGPVATGAQAIDLAKREKPDLILSDVKLRDGTSGIDAVDHIRSDIDIPVIYVTAYMDRVNNRKSDPDIYVLPKPFSNNLIRSFITGALLQRDLVLH